MDQACRRDRERVYPRKLRMAWGDSHGGPLGRAQVRDYSDSGVGLAVRSEDAPRTGEVIRLVTGSGETPKRARVVRVVSTGQGKTVIGCRWVKVRTHRAHRSGTERRALRRFSGRRVMTDRGEQ